MQSLRQLLMTILFLFIAAGPVTAAQFIVNNTADQVDAVPADGVCETAPGNGVCTLRAAIQQANALAGADTITLPAGTYTLTIPHDQSVPAGPDDASGNLAINNDLTISGAGAATTIIEAGPPVPPSPRFDGVITVYSVGVLPPISTLRVQISGVTIRNGDPRRHAGGGISNEATLDLIDVVVTGNRAGEIGGGIANVGTLTLTRSIVSGNTVQAGPGGGIHNQHIPGFTVGVVTLIDSTISGNTANEDGGGISNLGQVDMKNTIIAGNTALGGPDCLIDGEGQINSLGHNWVGSTRGCNFATANGDRVDIGDPLLGPLADNGGPTRTHALLVGSPAIDAGDNVGCPSTDQRGVLRPQGTDCDMGAFEFIQPVATFATDIGRFSNLSAVPESILPPTGKPEGLTFPFGFFSWTVTDLPLGQTNTVTITYPDPIPAGARYFKVMNNVWTEVASLLGDNDGDNVLTLTITDGGFGDEDGQANGQISDPGGVGIASAVAFATFSPEVEVKLRRGANNDTFEVEAFFTLGALSNGINPLTEDVSFTVGSFSTPALSFKQKKGRFKFEGVIDGVRLAAKIRPSRKAGFKFEAEGKCADLDGTVNPVTVELTIGDDRGSAAVTAEIESSRKGGKCGDRRDDDDDRHDKHDKDDDDD